METTRPLETAATALALHENLRHLHPRGLLCLPGRPDPPPNCTRSSWQTFKRQLPEDDLHPPVLRLANAGAGRHEKMGLPEPADGDDKARHAIAHQLAANRARTALASVPSVTIGLFAYSVLTAPFRHFSAFSASFAFAILMIPLIARSTEGVIRLVPIEVREAAVALGASKFRRRCGVS